MNFFKVTAALFAVACIASCNEKMITETPEGAGYITVTSQIGSQTKAGYETKTLPAEFIMDINQGNASFNYTKLKMTKDASSNEYIADKEDLKWATSTHEGAIVRAMTIPSGVASIDSDNIVEINLISNQTTLENFNKNDILGARNSENGGITIKGDNINVSFQHLMSKLHVIYETANTSTKVNAITLKNVCLGGAYSYEDINYVGSLEERGNINMYINTAAPDYSIYAAEAIFFPFEGMPTLEVTTNLGVKTCDLVSQNFKFERGKRYVLKISIDANGNVSKTNISTENDWVKNVPGGKILWIGTSIPAGGGTIFSYPQMVANATGLEVVNNAVGGSKVLKVPSKEMSSIGYVPFSWVTIDFETYPENGWNHLMAGGLAQTHQEAEQNYRTRLTDAANAYKADDWTDEKRRQWVDTQMNLVKSLSYESLIIPYIDGTIDNCNTIIIDHGFNDLQGIGGLHGMSWEAGGFRTGDEIVWGDAYFRTLTDKTSYEQYKQILLNNSNLTEEGSYLIAMSQIIEAIFSVNQNVRIIIGNYFALESPWVEALYGSADLEKYNFTSLICLYNETIANIWDLDIVNTYQDADIENFVNSDFYSFCPDGVHPSSDYTGKSNKAIADVYLQELAKIFSSTTTKSSSNSYDYGWEDVEIL